MRKTPAERFWAKVDLFSHPDGCWVWTASRTKDGYGQFCLSAGKGMVAHKWAYLWLVGPYDDALQLDHLCCNEPCVNPAHLEPVTPRENMLRSRAGELNRARRANVTHCKNDHAYEEVGFRMRGGTRVCRQCERDAEKRYRARKKAAL